MQVSPLRPAMARITSTESSSPRFSARTRDDDPFKATQRSVERITRSRAEVVTTRQGRYLQLVYLDDAERERMLTGLKRRGATEIPLTEFDAVPEGTVRLQYEGVKIQLYPLGDLRDWESSMFS